MMASILTSNFTSYTTSANYVIDDTDSLCSENEGKVSSDYSVSDIEDGLDGKAFGPESQRGSEHNFHQVSVDRSIPVKVRKRRSVNLNGLVDREKHGQEGSYNSTKGREERSDQLSTGDQPDAAKHSSKKSHSSGLAKRRSSKLAVKKETTKRLVLQLAPLFSANVQSVSSSRSYATEKTSIADDLRCETSTNGKKKLFRNNTADMLVDRSTKEFVAGSHKVSKSSRTNEGKLSNKPNLTLNESVESHPTRRLSPTSCASERSKCDSAENPVNQATTPSMSKVKKWKHYELAMEAYRKSAEKAKKATQQQEKDTNISNTLPCRSGRSIFEKESIYDFVDLKLDASCPKSGDQRSPASSQDSGFDESSNFADNKFATLPGLSFGSTKTEKSKPLAGERNLNLDYRSLLRRKGSRKGGWPALRHSVRRRSTVKRTSVDPDTITDIDVMVGFADFDQVTNVCQKEVKPSVSNIALKTSTKIDITIADKLALNHHGEAKPYSESTDTIVWSGYEKFTNPKTETDAPKSSFQMRLSALGKKRSGSVPFLSMGKKSPPVLTAVDNKKKSDLYVSDTNLRQNRIIRKRNFSLSKSILPWYQNNQKVVDSKHETTASPRQENHKVTKPVPLPRLLEKEENKNSLSVVSSYTPPTPYLRSTNLRERNHLTTIQVDSSISSENLCFGTSDTEVVTQTCVKSLSLPKPTSLSVDDETESCTTRDGLQILSYQFRGADNVSSTDTGEHHVRTNSDEASLSKDISSRLRRTNITSFSEECPYSVPRYSYNCSSVVSNTRLCSHCYNTSTTANFPLSRAMPNLPGSTDVPQIHKTLSPPAVHVTSAKSPSLQFATAIASGNVSARATSSDNTAEMDSDDDNDYVNFESFYEEKPITEQKTTPSTSELRERKALSLLKDNLLKSNQDVQGLLSMSKNRKRLSTLGKIKSLKSPIATKSTKSYAVASNRSNSYEPNNPDNNIYSMSASYALKKSLRKLKKSEEENAPAPLTRRSLTLPSLLTSKDKRRSIFRSRESELDRKTPKKRRDVSVPLTDLMNEPKATFTLDLGNTHSNQDAALEKVSTFINSDSIQRVDAICEIFEKRTKDSESKPKSQERFLAGVRRVLKLNKIAPNTASRRELSQPQEPLDRQHQQQSQVQNTSYFPGNKAATQADDKKLKTKQQKKKLTKADISMPSGFQHVGHVGWNSNKSYDTHNLDPDLKELLGMVGVTEKDIRQDEKKAKFIYKFIEKRGGVEAVRRETRRHRNQPPSRAKAGPAPPPFGGGPPRASRVPPPPPQRFKPGSPGVPPPPPVPTGVLSPASTNAPPPPPPPPPVGPPAPPPNNMKPNFQSTSSAPASLSGRDALLDAIRKGKDLKSVAHDLEEEKSPTSETTPSGDDGLAGALARALLKRETAIQSGSDSDSEGYNDDEEWED